MSIPIPDARTEGGKTASGTSLAWNHTIGSGLSNVALLVEGQVSNAGKTDLTGVQWDAAGAPVSLTEKGVIADSAGFAHASIWYLLNPAVVGTRQVKLSAATSQMSGGSSSYSNVDQTTPFNAASPQTATGTGP